MKIYQLKKLQLNALFIGLGVFILVVTGVTLRYGTNRCETLKSEIKQKALRLEEVRGLLADKDHIEKVFFKRFPKANIKESAKIDVLKTVEAKLKSKKIIVEDIRKSLIESSPISVERVDVLFVTEMESMVSFIYDLYESSEDYKIVSFSISSSENKEKSLQGNISIEYTHKANLVEKPKLGKKEINVL